VRRGQENRFREIARLQAIHQGRDVEQDGAQTKVRFREVEHDGVINLNIERAKRRG